MGRPSNTEERRAQIARALMKVMAKHGYDGASVADVAAAARLSPGLVHYHFENKQEILLSALRQLVAQHEARLEARLAEAGEPGSQLEAYLDFHLGLGADADPEALACWVLVSGEALRQPKVRVEYEKAISALTGRLADLIGRGIEAGAFRCEKPAVAASALVALVQGYFVLAAAARVVIPRGSAAVAARSMAEGLLRPSRPFAAGKERRR